MRKLSVLFAMTLLPTAVVPSPASSTYATNNDQDISSQEIPVLVSEVTTGGTFINEDGETEEDHYIEFVELYNHSPEAIDISDWKLQYLPWDGDNSNDDDWSNKLLQNQDDYSYTIEPKSFYVIATNNFIEKLSDYEVDLKLRSGSRQDGGHIRLLRPNVSEQEATDTQWQLVDFISWGDATHVHGDGKPAIAPARDESLQRCFKDGELVNTDNNAEDFRIREQPSPGEGIECPESSSDEDQDSDQNDGKDHQNSDDTENDTENVDACSDVILTEVLPRSTQTHASPFIELYNTGEEAALLDECGLEITSEGGVTRGAYWLPETELEPDAYYRVDKKTHDVNLFSSVGATVYLLGNSPPTPQEQHQAVYPGDMPDGASWARFGPEDWEQTYQPTPGTANRAQSERPCPDGQYRHHETNRCRNQSFEEDELVPCDDHQYRHPETNRCRNLETSSRELIPCEDHQYRSPETNRCRNLETQNQLVPCEDHQYRHPETNRCRNLEQNNGLVPCKPHQERNPETNRCRNIDSASSSLVPCEDHQYRHPETNRCRNKVVDNEEAINQVEDVQSVATGMPANWWFAGAMFLLACGYGIWEWRYDIRNHIYRWRHY